MMRNKKEKGPGKCELTRPFFMTYAWTIKNNLLKKGYWGKVLYLLY